MQGGAIARGLSILVLRIFRCALGILSMSSYGADLGLDFQLGGHK